MKPVGFRQHNEDKKKKECLWVKNDEKQFAWIWEKLFSEEYGKDRKSWDQYKKRMEIVVPGNAEFEASYGR